jgi:hypothetical protein
MVSPRLLEELRLALAPFAEKKHRVAPASMLPAERELQPLHPHIFCCEGAPPIKQ